MPTERRTVHGTLERTIDLQVGGSWNLSMRDDATDNLYGWMTPAEAEGITTDMVLEKVIAETPTTIEAELVAGRR